MLLAFLPLFGFRFYELAGERRRALDEVRLETQRLARLVAGDQENLLRDATTTLKVLAHLPEVQERDDPACGMLFADVKGHYPHYVNIGAADLTGTAYCSAVPMSTPVQVGDRPWFQQALVLGDVVVGERQVSRATGTATFNVAYLVRDDAGRTIGVVTVALDPSRFYDLIVWEGVSEETVVVVTDRRGAVLVSHPVSRYAAGDPLPADHALYALMSESALIMAQYAGVDDRTGTYSAQPIYEGQTVRSEDTTDLYTLVPVYMGERDAMYVLVDRPKAVAFAPVEASFRRDITVLSIVALLVIVGAWLVAHFLVLRPVLALRNVTRELAYGKLSARVGQSHWGDGELGQLARAFDQMADELETNVAQIVSEQQELRRSRQRLLSAEETVRRDIAQQLHGTVQNKVVFLLIRFRELLRADLSEGARSGLEAVRQQLEDLLENDIRAVSRQLYPSVLRHGLVPGIESLRDRFESAVPIDVHVDRKLREIEGHDSAFIDERVRLTAYRIVEEASTNILKHAKGDGVRAQVWVEMESEDRISASVRDNGKGFDMARQSGGVGLATMRDYAEATGGERARYRAHPAKGRKLPSLFQLQGLTQRVRGKA